jgi:hypothetical protein
MAKSYQRTLLVGLLTLVPLIGACEQMDISGVTETAAPTAAFHSQQTKLLTRAWSSMPATVVSDWITAGKTARLKLGKYELWVPKGAVANPTIFRMTVLGGPLIGVSLEAFDNNGNRVTRFQVPLKLTLPYDEARFVVDNESSLLLANIASETDYSILEIVDPNVDNNAFTVTGSITHFSIWTLAIELSKELSPGID